MNDMPHRSALADYLTILTGLFTILSGAYSLYAGGDVSAAADTETYWDGPLRHAIAITLTVMGLYFFMDLSVKIAGKIVRTGTSGLPGWLVLAFSILVVWRYTGSFRSCSSQSVCRIKISYFITSLVIWLVLTIPLAIMSAFKPNPAVKASSYLLHCYFMLYFLKFCAEEYCLSL